MKRNNRKAILIFSIMALTLSTVIVFADYPLLDTITYSADPSGLEYNGVLYIYWSNDDNNNDSYQMHQITCLSTTDLKTWTNHGQVFDVPRDCSWATYSWAPSVVYRDGTFWMYFGNSGSNIGVAKSSSPTGPFTDAKGSPLITPSMPNCNVDWCFDPGVLIDDDGRIYMFFGGGGPGNCRVIELGNDMISTIGTAITIDAPLFFEASWIHKYNGNYYLSYSSDFSQGAPTIEYMMSSSPMSGYVHKGTVLPNPPDNNGNNNHAGIFQYSGNWYIGYHNQYVSIQQGLNTTYKRNACMDQVFYNTDDTMKVVVSTRDGLPLLTGTSDPTLEPTPTQTPAPTGIPIQDPIFSGGPYSLNGTSDYVDLPDGLTSDLYDFSIACRVNLNSLDTWTRVYDFGGDTNIFMMFTPASGTTGNPYFCITLTGNDGEQGLNGNSALPTGSWQHIAVTKSGSTGILYINGQEVNRNTNMTLNPADMGNTTNNYIGRSQWEQDPYLNGEVDEFFVYNRAISASEVAALADPTEPTPTPTTGTLGDVNGDGSIDIVDALLIAQYYVNLEPANFIPGNADANCDDSIDIVDALLIAQYYVGLINGFC